MADRPATPELRRMLERCLRPREQPCITFDRAVLAAVLEELIEHRTRGPSTPHEPFALEPEGSSA